MQSRKKVTTRSFWVLLLSNMPMGKVTAASRASATPRRETPSTAAMRPTRKTEPAPASHCRRLSSRSPPLRSRKGSSSTSAKPGRSSWRSIWVR